MEFNIHQLIVEEELDDNNRWNDSKIEAYSNAIIEYDPFDYAKKILKQNVVFDNKRAFNRLVWILQQYKWRGQIHSIRCYYRGCPQASHDLLNNCVELLLEAVYLLNERYVPHKKWEFIFLDELEYGCDLKSLFANAMLVKSFTFESILERIEVLDKIFKQIEEMAYKKYKDFPSRPYEFYYRNFVQLNKVTKADEFYFEMTGKLDVENNKDELIFGKICYDVDKL